MPEEEFIRKAAEFREKESVLDGNCIYELSQGLFPRHLMERFGLIRYAGKTGKTRIVIEYNNDTGEGWKRIVSECEESIPTRKDQTDIQQKNTGDPSHYTR